MAKDTKKEERAPEQWVNVSVQTSTLARMSDAHLRSVTCQNGGIEKANERLVGSNWPLLQVLLSELTKLEFELFW